MLKYTELGALTFIAKEDTKRHNTLNPLLIEPKNEDGAILIDANYPFRHIDFLYGRIKKAKALLLSHAHTDHMAHAFYHRENYNTEIFVPIQESAFIKDLSTLREATGFTGLGLSQPFNLMVREYMKFQECTDVNSYIPGETIFKYQDLNIETIHIPGHSPGHTAFSLQFFETDQNRDILFVSDIGSHPYYGDNFCDLKQYFESIAKLEKIYLSEDYILVPAHGTTYIEKDKDFFNRIRKRINRNEKKVFEALSKTTPKSIKELIYEGTLTPKENINHLVRELYQVWDGGMIYRHLLNFIEQGLVKKVVEKDYLNDKYILT